MDDVMGNPRLKRLPPPSHESWGNAVGLVLASALLFTCGGEDATRLLETESVDANGRSSGAEGTAGQPTAGAGSGGSANDGASAGAEAEASDPAPASAIIIAERVLSPEGRLYYLSAVAEVPSGPLDRSRALELSSADVEVFQGAVFVRDRQSNRMSRFSVSDALELVEEGAFSFQNTGLGSGRVRNAYLSPTRAVAMDAQDWRLIEWNPTSMELTGVETSIEHFAKEGLPDGFIGNARRVGDKLIAQVAWNDYENLITYPGLGALLVIDGNDGPPALIEDERVAGGFLVYGDEQGNAYLPGVIGADLTLFGSAHGGGLLPASGMVRISVGGMTFDEDYFVDVSAISGSPGVWAIHRIDETHLLVQLWDPEAPIDSLTSADDYYSASEFIYGIVDIEAQTFESIDSIPRGGTGNAYDHVVDGVLYVQTSIELGDGQFESSVHRVTPTGTAEAFTVPGGDLWHLERLR
jgi:hypothetical protein